MPPPRTVPARAARQRRRWRPVLRWTVRCVLYGTLFAVAGLAGMVVAALPELPAIERSGEFRRVEGAIVARDGRTRLRALRTQTSRRYAREADIGPLLADAVIAAEDRSFRSHPGIDPRGIVRAALVDLRAGELREGGSTITQQLVKNAYLSPERNLGRKTREAMLAVALETSWSKQRVLTAYLNTAYFGNGTYGVLDASRAYFGRHPRHLRLHEAALLAGLLRSPELDDPLRAPQRARDRRAHVLDAMVATGRISRARADAAAVAPLPRREGVARRTRPAGELAPHFADAVVGELVKRHGVATTFGGRLWVRTTLDARMQRAARDATRRLDGTGLSTAIVAIDPATGEIRALALGGPAARQAFDVASAGQRQPGSAFKPFVLAAAYANRYSPQSVVLSAPYRRRYPAPIGEYVVRNASGAYAGPQQLQAATWHSDNTVYARVANDVGLDEVIRFARAAGIQSRMQELPSLALGALPEGTSPVELGMAYATLAAHGRRVTGEHGGPVRVLRVRRNGRDGSDLHVVGRRTARAMPRSIADLVTRTLEGVITSGTGTAAAIDRPAAGKTGTTDDNVDAWFAGYTPDLVAVVWVGHPEGAIPMQREYHGAPVSGGSYPAEIWADFMQGALASRPARRFRYEQVEHVTVVVDRETRLLADEWCARVDRETFVRGLEPTRFSDDCPERTRPAPDVGGMAVEQAERRLQRLGFAFERRETAGDADELGIVVDQLPAAGDEVRRDQPIRLYVVTRAIGR